jgi:hypothetical protein
MLFSPVWFPSSSLVMKLGQEKLAMCQKEIGEPKMEIAQARQLHQGLIARLMQGPGDSEGAMHRAEQKFGLSYWSQWNLRHKSRASLQFIVQLHGACLSSVENSVKRDLEYLKTEKAKGADDASLESLSAQAENLLAEIAALRARKGAVK